MLFLNNEPDEDFVNMLVYGRSGTGKTTLGCTAPKPLFLLSERQGWDSIRKASKALGQKPPPTFLLQHNRDLQDAIRALNSDHPIQTLVKALVWNDEQREAKKENREPDPEIAKERADETIAGLPYTDVKTIVLDSITDFFRLVSEEIDEQAPPKLGKDGLPVKADRYWATLRERCERTVRRFRDVPFHVLYLALLDDRTVGDDDQKTRQVGPDCPMRALPSAIMACTNMVGIMSVQVKLQPKKDGEQQDALVRHWVRFAGPDWMMTKPNRPLRDIEVPNVSVWLHTLKTKDPGDVLDLGQGMVTEAELSMDAPPETAETAETADDEDQSDQADAQDASNEDSDPESTEEAQSDTEPPRPSNGRELLAAIKRGLQGCGTHGEIAELWLEYSDLVERCRDRAPKTFEGMVAATTSRCSEILDEVAERTGNDPGITADDLYDRAMAEYEERRDAQTNDEQEDSEESADNAA